MYAMRASRGGRAACARAGERTRKTEHAVEQARIHYFISMAMGPGGKFLLFAWRVHIQITVVIPDVTIAVASNCKAEPASVIVGSYSQFL